MDGTRSQMQDLSDIFTDALNNRYSITTEKTDERLSTREAKEEVTKY